MALIVPAPCDPPVGLPTTRLPLAVMLVAATAPPDKLVAVVAVPALPVTLIGHVPEALPPVALAALRFESAPAAVVAPVPPFPIPTTPETFAAVPDDVM